MVALQEIISKVPLEEWENGVKQLREVEKRNDNITIASEEEQRIVFMRMYLKRGNLTGDTSPTNKTVANVVSDINSVQISPEDIPPAELGKKASDANVIFTRKETKRLLLLGDKQHEGKIPK